MNFIFISILCLQYFEYSTEQNTSDVKDLEGCKAEMLVNWWPIEPYLFGDSTEPKGKLRDIVERIMIKCCGDGVKLKFANPSNDSEALKDQIGLNGSVISMPIYGDESMIKFKSVPFFSLIEAPGVIYLQGPPVPGATSEAVLTAVFQGWPILLLTLVMAALSGMIMWALDSYWNPQHFPNSFVKGSWEGFWWAFVSMTTVGYGDRAPKSFVARIFAFFWVLVGLVIISIFTATVTTSLTALSLGSPINLYGSKVVALQNSAEQRYAVQNNAKVFTVTNVADFINIVEAKQTPSGESIDGGVVDSYLSGTKLFSSSNKLQYGKVFDYQYTYGFVITNDVNTQAVEKCLRQALNSEESYITDIVLNMKAYPIPEMTAAQQTSSSLFDPTSDIFTKAVYGCLGLIGFFSICCLIWEYCYWKPKMKKNNVVKPEAKRVLTPHTSFEELIAAQCHDLEEKLVDQVTNFYKEFHKKLNKIRKEHSIGSTEFNKKALLNNNPESSNV